MSEIARLRLVFVIVLVASGVVAPLVGASAVGAQAQVAPVGPEGETPEPPTPTEPVAPPAGGDDEENGTGLPPVDGNGSGVSTPNGSSGMSGVGTGMCEGTGFGAKSVCQGVVGAVRGVGQAVGQVYANVTVGAMRWITDRPAAMRDGERVWHGVPDGPVLRSAMDDRHLAMKIGILLVFIFGSANLLAWLGPNISANALPPTQALWEMVVKSVFIVMTGWIYNILSHIAEIMSLAFLPPKSEMAASVFTAAGTGPAVLIVALIIWFTGGLTAVGAVLQFFLSWILSIVLGAALPIAIALTVPRFWIFDRLRPVGKSIIDVTVPVIFYPVPAAFILGIGYGFANDLARAVPDLFAFLPGVGAGVAITVGLIQLCTWVGAVFAPPFLLALSLWRGGGGSGLLSSAIGFAAGASLSGVGSSSKSSSGGSGAPSGLPSGPSPSGLPAGSSSLPATTSSDLPASTTVAEDTAASVSSLSPDSKSGAIDTPSSGVGGPPSPSVGGKPVVSSDQSTTSSSRASGAAAGATSTTSSSAGASSGTSSTSSASGTSGTRTRTSAGGPDITEVHDRVEFDAGKKYQTGVVKDGEFSNLVNHTTSGEALADRGRFKQMNKSKHAGENDVILQDPDDGSLYDIGPIAADDRESTERMSHEDEVRMGRDAVYGTGSD